MIPCFKIGIVAVSIGLLFYACNDQDFQNLDLNPQVVNEIDLNFMFTPIPLQLASGPRIIPGFLKLFLMYPMRRCVISPKFSGRQAQGGMMREIRIIYGR